MFTKLKVHFDGKTLSVKSKNAEKQHPTEHIQYYSSVKSLKPGKRAHKYLVRAVQLKTCSTVRDKQLVQGVEASARPLRSALHTLAPNEDNFMSYGYLLPMV